MTDIEEITRIDELIIEEKRNMAREQFSELWDNAVEEGIEIEIIADELILGALLELAKNRGDQAVQAFVASINKREKAGEFIPNRVLQ